MSYRIGRDVLRLRNAPRLGHTEYCSNWALIEHVSGLPKDDPRATPLFRERFEFDFNWLTSAGPIPWKERGRVTDMGHAEWLADGSDRRETIYCPFASAEEVLAFDAVQEYGLPDADEMADYFQETWRGSQKLSPEAVIPGGYYPTIVSGAIAAFGWDMLLEAAADSDRFERVLDSIFRLSLHHYKAWARTDIEFFISHDDMVWSQGAFMRPDFYRRAIFPRYRELWRVLKDAGKRVLFCSDANWSEFVDDIVAAGADGFIFEPMTALEPIVAKYGQTHVIVSSKVDCRTLTFGTQEDIRAEVDATLALAKPCPGFMFAVGNHIPSNVPVENALFMFNYLRERWRR